MRSIFLSLMAVLSFSVSMPARAEVHGEAVEYKDGDTVLEGFLAYDDTILGPRPGVLVVHEWKGLNDYARGRAKQLAGLGYTAFAIDMYGKGVVAKDHDEAAKLSGVYRSDRALMRRRAKAGLEVLKGRQETDPARIAAMGYCFGGTTSLELGRAGEELKGIATFHAGLSNPNPADAKNIKCPVVVFHGADDSFVNVEVPGFEMEMKAAGANYRIVKYPGAVHSFTVPEAGNDPSQGMAYNADADTQSWEELTKFLAEVFKA